VDAEDAQTPISDEVYYIVPGKCTECKGFHDEPQCAAVCPVDCCIPDEHVETEETLLSRQTQRLENKVALKKQKILFAMANRIFYSFDIIAQHYK
jgi:ferredoxin